MTKDEALKLALEALETCYEDEWHSEDDFGLAQTYDENKVAQAIAAIEEALAQPAQEPVAWPCHIIEADFSERTITLGMECGDYKVSSGTHWLSTTPPAAQPAQERNFCSRCGKRTNDIHTCTPPQEST
jgi:hypothetical protein